MHPKNILRKIIINTKKNRPINTDHDECIIFGSGPSLDKLDYNATFLEGKDLIGCNFIHKHQSLAGKNFSLFSMIDRDYTRHVDKLYFKDLSCDNFLIASKNAGLLKARYLAQGKVNIIQTRMFNEKVLMDKEKIISGSELVTGNSLPFLIQCAAFLAGYKTIYLYGVDHFSIDDLHDDNNFNNYDGRKIKDLSMTRKKLEYINSLYSFIGSICKDEGVKVFNITPNSKLEVFDTLDVDVAMVS